MRAPLRFPSWLLLLPVLLPGCPSSTSNPYGDKKAPPAPEVGADDPRVVVKDGELYTQKTIERAEERMRDDGIGLGSGRPDETNGECRLFAPKLPHPQCCKGEFGFDVATVSEACGLPTYLGESFRNSCGYYFHHDEGPRWFRLSKLPETSAKQAADHHDRKMAESLGERYQPSTPVPGVEGAWWSRHENYRWAFLPGWDNVRQLSWEDASCSDEGITTVMAQVIAAKPAPDHAQRLALVPKARM
ncbi:hypothetical protein [Paraliomyxa miuraensis]|uniref:hypothetical protein n=1 Tax=Paraliomyxa miuraensis TaxID=376150 RepID=UPI00225B9415|nr:hypothetical protein [Paraliomyxa miuraensis]MCX4239991.1 hypothetical protein [Paraliomyxa miuraensis]